MNTAIKDQLKAHLQESEYALLAGLHAFAMKNGLELSEFIELWDEVGEWMAHMDEHRLEQIVLIREAVNDPEKLEEFQQARQAMQAMAAYGTVTLGGPGPSEGDLTSYEGIVGGPDGIPLGMFMHVLIDATMTEGCSNKTPVKFVMHGEDHAHPVRYTAVANPGGQVMILLSCTEFETQEDGSIVKPLDETEEPSHQVRMESVSTLRYWWDRLFHRKAPQPDFVVKGMSDEQLVDLLRGLGHDPTDG